MQIILRVGHQWDASKTLAYSKLGLDTYGLVRFYG